MLLSCKLCVKCSPRHLTSLVCLMCVPFNWIFGGFRFRSVNVMWLHVNVIWLHLLEFVFICLPCSHFSILLVCSCSNVAAVSALVCLTYIRVVRECQYFAVGMWLCISCIILVLKCFLAVPLP